MKMCGDYWLESMPAASTLTRFHLALCLLLASGPLFISAQCGPNNRPYPPGTQECPDSPGGGGGGDAGGGTGGVVCPSDGVGYTGDASYIGQGPQAAPLRGTVGCVDANTATGAPLTVTVGGNTQIANIIYGPLEAGFTSSVPNMACLGDNVVPPGIDTLIAESMVQVYCNDYVSVLDNCGGHAVPYHYHERMDCLFFSDPDTGHSTRIGTMLDGNGLYGKYVAENTLPTDLDACGGRTGVTPDSGGQEVYYYMVQERAPFTVGCFGPVSSIEECRALYDGCGDGDEIEVETASYGTFPYDPECPCYDASNSYDNTGATVSPPAATSPPPPSPPSPPPSDSEVSPPAATSSPPPSPPSPPPSDSEVSPPAATSPPPPSPPPPPSAGIAVFTAALDIDVDNLPDNFDTRFKAEIASSAEVETSQVQYTFTATSRRHLLANTASADVVVNFDSLADATKFVDTYSDDSSAIFSSDFTDEYSVTVVSGSLTASIAPSPSPPSPSPSVSIDDSGMQRLKVSLTPLIVAFWVLRS